MTTDQPEPRTEALDEKVIALLIGGSLLLAAVGIDRSGHESITPVIYCGAIAFLYGFFDSVKRTPFEIMFLRSPRVLSTWPPC